LSKKHNQLHIEIPDTGKQTIPIEDIGILILDNAQITITNAVLRALVENNTAVLTNDEKHLKYQGYPTMTVQYPVAQKDQEKLLANLSFQKILLCQTAFRR